MTVTSLRPHRRFAVRQRVHISHAHPASVGQVDGLLIELSIRGCRISNIDPSPFAHGDAIQLEIDGFSPIHGSVRMADRGVLCMTFATPLYTPVLDNLITRCRAPHPDPAWSTSHSMSA